MRFVRNAVLVSFLLLEATVAFAADSGPYTPAKPHPANITQIHRAANVQVADECRGKGDNCNKIDKCCAGLTCVAAGGYGGECE